MDTIELSWDDPAILKQAWLFAVTHCKMDQMIDPATGRKQYPKRSSAYVRSGCFSFGGVPFYICYQPKFKNLPFCKMVFHLSKYRSWQEFYDFAMKLFGGMSDEFFKGRIHRLDVCLDIDVPFDTARKIFYVKDVYKCILMSNRGDVHTVALGREPQQTVFYSKPMSQVFELDWKRKDQDIIDSSKTERSTSLSEDEYALRLELRFWNKCLPIESLRQLGELREGKLFSHVVMQDVDEELIQDLDTRTKRTVHAYMYMRDQYCAEMARLSFGKTKTYPKIKKYLGRIDDLDLNAIWVRRFDRWFAGFEVPA